MSRQNSSQTALYQFFKKNTNTSLPFSIRITSGKPGKAIVILGGVHGNETVGIHFAHRFLHRHKKKIHTLKSGSITFILGNPDAFKAGVRYIDSDLNRSFTDKSTLDTTKTEHRRALNIRAYLTSHTPHAIIDLHSVSIGDFKILVTRTDDKQACENIKKIKTIDTVFLFQENHIPGTTIAEARKHNTTAFAIECGNHNAHSAIQIAEEAVYNTLQDLDMLSIKTQLPHQKKAQHTTKTQRTYRTIGIIKSGHNFRYMVQNPTTGLPVKKNDPIAHTKEHGIQKAPCDCILFMPSKKPKPTDHEAGFLCIEC